MSIEPWLFQVSAHLGESFGHFLSRFRRANHLSSSQLSVMLGHEYMTVSYWETPSRRRRPGAEDLEALSRLTGVDVAQLNLMIVPRGFPLYLRTRLCAFCYEEAQFHKLVWQDVNIFECDRHCCQLLSVCPRCKMGFRLPAYWDGQCDQCHLPFVEMSTFSGDASRSSQLIF
jgi:transcriptional regulator with XRE-family HTH domain